MADPLFELGGEIQRCYGADRARLRHRLRMLRARLREGKPIERGLEELRLAVMESTERRERRVAQAPEVTYPQDLPVVARREEIREAIRRNRVVVVCGETGSGKSTQLPKIVLEAGGGRDGMIAHTQPRRIAARSIAMRLAEELRSPVGHAVGYKVRFQDRTSPDCYVKVLTDGMLLAETQGDRELRQYDTIIIDEAHERSLNIDFLLGYLAQVLERRGDLRLIVTSATIDPERFSRHFGGAPIISVSGRTYPVEVRYRPPDSAIEDERERTQKAILRAIDELAEHGEGDVLVFLPGEREIREAAEALRKHHPKGTQVLPLFARLSAEEQQRIFETHRDRRVILATNVAEMSLTVPGIRYVVDTGTARIGRYSHRTKVQRLEVEPISRASADQRKGRCGRIGPGVCVRLYGEDEFDKRDEFTQPEILRSNLAGVILRMKSLHLGRVEKFPFVEAPDARMIREGYRTLHELGAVTEEGELTALGQRLARLPIDPRIGRMVLASDEAGCMAEVLVIASALSVQDPRERPALKRDEADAAHSVFEDEHSDFLTLINLWRAYHERGRHLSQRKLGAWCREHFLSAARMREWHDVHAQLRELSGQMGLHASGDEADAEAVHRALLSGLISNIGTLAEGSEYAGAHGTRFHLFPGSVLFESRPRWVMCAELVRTTRLYARTVAPIKPQWVEPYAGHLITRKYGPARWDNRRARVVADESVSLYGLELIPHREVAYGAIDPVVSREVFIHHALVEGELRTRGAFVKHNQRLIEGITRMEERLRRRDLLADNAARFAFFDRIVPQGVYSGEAFEAWRRTAERADPEILFMGEEDLLAHRPAPEQLEQFPRSMRVNGSTLSLSYRFEPGAPDDGVTITVPAEALSSIEERDVDWGVPGLVRDKAVELVKTLPKEYRRQIGPGPQFVDEFLASEPARHVPLARAMSEFLVRKTGTLIPEHIWAESRVAEHLRPMYRVVDDGGRVLATGREIKRLRADLVGTLRERAGIVRSPAHEADGLKAWTVGDLPESVGLERGGVRVTAFPAMIDRGDGVDVRLFDDPARAAQEQRRGVLRLLRLSTRDDVERLTRRLPDLDRAGLLYAAVGPATDIREDVILAALDEAVIGRDVPRTRAAFDAAVERVWGSFPAACAEVCRVVSAVLAERQWLVLELEHDRPAAWQAAIGDLRSQLSRLMPARFASGRSLPALRDVLRYLRAMRVRVERLARGGFDRDGRALAEVARCERALHEVATRGSAPAFARDIEEVRRWIDELRVGLFAQDLGTAGPVSAKRVLQMVDALAKRVPA
ncbi:MAG: ATP-dependent RNA helicase HrpA [Phycisphaeraceae bacterium]|nr:ATP-dependent RNA helicase HrpA [Phycisphaeraceae bacterium]